MSGFASAVIHWQKRHGRQGLPWQGTRDPYRIWLSEVMLQQTQVAAVIPYFDRFLKKYPTLKALAGAQEDDVLRLWSGLGYYARGRNLLTAAKEVARRGKFPDTPEAIAELPGVGRSTAAAIAAFAFGRRAAILDGNVKRVLARCFAIETEKDLWLLAERLLPKRGIVAYTQGLMDLGATVCVRVNPRCNACPVNKVCVAKKQNRIDELPAPRPRKALPTRSVTWLVLRRAGQVLLEKRPSSGIWGGLWSFPEAGPRQLEYDIRATRELEPLEHGFTHFRLRIRPLLCDLRKAAPRAEEPGRLWIDIADALDAALPTPVRKVLGRLS
ncbi:MAG: A/G-specific adenine glycosylase [Pseudomonadota bacterium]|nr:A/G-specific adenine glycosylase [Pseudomonadota bacterium]